MSVKHDFLNWTSFPSSLKLVVPPGQEWFGVSLDSVSVKPGSKVRVEVNAKFQNIYTGRSHIGLDGYDGKEWRRIAGTPIDSGVGSLDWEKVSLETVIPSGVVAVRVFLATGAGTPDIKAATWFDDLKIYMDDQLIYENYFTALRPGKVVPVIWTPPERIIGAWQRFKQGEKVLIFKPPRILQTVRIQK